MSAELFEMLFGGILAVFFGLLVLVVTVRWSRREYATDKFFDPIAWGLIVLCSAFGVALVIYGALYLIKTICVFFQ